MSNSPPVPEREQGPSMASRAAAVMMLTGAALVLVTVLLPPPAQGSDTLILAFGGLSGLMGVALLRFREVPEAVLGIGTVVGTVVITLCTREAGLFGSGADDNEVLYLWVCLYAFYFFSLPHALFQLGVVAVAYGILLVEQAPADTVLTRLLTTMGTFLVAGLLVAWLRDSVRGMMGELSRRARLDPLTGALNRGALEERAALELARSRRARAPIGVVVVDIDRLKDLNDRFGHAAGDAALRRVAEELRAETRVVDAVARIGGDEFMILLPGASPGEARAIAERLRVAVRGRHASSLGNVTLSMGVATASWSQASFEDLGCAADAAMYAAKRAGGDAIGFAGERGRRPGVLSVERGGRRPASERRRAAVASA